MRDSTEAFGVYLDEATVEALGAIATVERYHAPLRLAYERIYAATDHQTSELECLRLAVFTVGCTFEAEGLCPTLFLFGAIPQPARTLAAPSQLERAKVIHHAMEEVGKEQARRKFTFSSRHIKGQMKKDQPLELRKPPAVSPVLVHCIHSK